jgi:hypothetical protein
MTAQATTVLRTCDLRVRLGPVPPEQLSKIVLTTPADIPGDRLSHGCGRYPELLRSLPARNSSIPSENVT